MKTISIKHKPIILCCLILLTACKTDELLKVTKLQNGEITEITYNSAKASAVFIDIGEYVTDFGHCWNTAGSPTTSDNKYIVSGTAQKGEYTSELTGLTGNKTYYVKAYAIDGGETIYGGEIDFKTLETPFINITSPTSDSLWEMGFVGQIKWTHNIDGNVKIELLKGGAPVGNNIESDLANSGYYNWTIPDNETLTDRKDYAIRISSVDNAGISDTSQNFEIFGKISDYDQNKYRIVKIGEQWWMKENLKATHFMNGTAIPNVTDNAAWQALSHISLAYCYYNNSSTNGITYGALYTWAAANNGLCPIGWHLPSDEDWKRMEFNIGMMPADTGLTGWRGNVGKKLKESGTSHWSTPNTGNDSLEFTALPGGYREENGNFGAINNYAYFWTSTQEGGNLNAWHRGLRYDINGIARSYYLKRYGRSVRCVKN